MFEAFKGAIALASAYFLIIMIRRDVDFEDAAEHILFSLHISPSHHWSQEFLHAADKISSTSIAMIGAIAITYAAAALRGGLWLVETTRVGGMAGHHLWMRLYPV